MLIANMFELIGASISPVVMQTWLLFDHRVMLTSSLRRRNLHEVS
jgi:hypothetical protein